MHRFGGYPPVGWVHGTLTESLGRPVKKMIGGVTGWLDEGFGLEVG